MRRARLSIHCQAKRSIPWTSKDELLGRLRQCHVAQVPPREGPEEEVDLDVLGQIRLDQQNLLPIQGAQTATYVIADLAKQPLPANLDADGLRSCAKLVDQSLQTLIFGLALL